MNPVMNLKPLELKILELMARGKTPKAIADDVGRHHTAVNAHIRRACQRNSVRTVLELMYAAAKRGMV